MRRSPSSSAFRSVPSSRGRSGRIVVWRPDLVICATVRREPNEVTYRTDDRGVLVSSDDERISYLAGEPAGELDADERAALDEFRALLADPSLWVEPEPELEERVVAAIAAEV